MKTGKFITIEGCEGVGKSTLIAHLKQFCEENSINAVFTREPGGTEISESIRNIILDASKNTENVTELLLYEAARRQHVVEKILPLLSQNVTVICDRFTDSTLCYQGYGRGMDKKMIMRLNDIATNPLKIDATVFLKLEPEKGFKRKGGADKGDRLECAGLEFHKRVFEGFMELSLSEPRFITIDADKSEEDVFFDVVQRLSSRKLI